MLTGQQRQGDTEAALLRGDALDRVLDDPVEAQIQTAGQPDVWRKVLNGRQVLAVAGRAHALQGDAVAQWTAVVDASQRPTVAVERDALGAQREAQIGVVGRADAIVQADPVHATIQPQQQLIAATAERCIRMAVHADIEQLQSFVSLRQRQCDCSADMRFQLHVERVAAGLQLRLCHGGTGWRALGRLDQPVAQLIQQVLAGQVLRTRASG